MKCKPNEEFIVTETGHIEIRNKDGTFIYSIACKHCLKELKKAIKELESNLNAKKNNIKENEKM